MSLSKQLYLLISFIFIMIFTGNFIINVKNTKEYLEIESQTRVQDTATSLGMTLKPLLKDKKDPEIESIIKAIANSGFYKEIRLDDAYFTVNETDLIMNSTNLDEGEWFLSLVNIDKKFGEIALITSDNEMSKELSLLEHEEIVDEEEEIKEKEYYYKPASKYKNGGLITFDFIATSNKKEIKSQATLNITKNIVQVSRAEKFDYVPEWFINMISFNMQGETSEISNGWKTTAVIYVSANAGDAYAKLYEQVKSALIYSAIAFVISMSLLFVFVQYLLKPLPIAKTLYF